MNKIYAAGACLLLMSLIPLNSYAGKILSGDEIKELITDKTVFVTLNSSTQWRQYHAANGESYRDNGNISDWYVEDNMHCNTAARLVCAEIRDNEDGTYARLKNNGETAVIWNKIIDGKDF